MRMGLVTGTIVATQKDQNLVGCKLLIIQQINGKGEVIGNEEIAVDAFGAGIGEKVMLCSGSTARSVLGNPNAPIDLTIVGIIDVIEKSGDR